MIRAICINDKKKPKEVQKNEWIQEGVWYNITHIYIQRNQGNIQGCELKEVKLTFRSAPYETYALYRFGILDEDMPKFIELCKACTKLDEVDIKKLIEESELQTVEK